MTTEPASGPSALLIERDLLIGTRLLNGLRTLGYVVRRSPSGEEALAAIQADRPEIVLLNLASPALGGTDLIASIKAMPNPPKVLAYMSHVLIPTIRDQALAAGVDRLCANSAITARLEYNIKRAMQSVAPEADDTE
jgi:CheY-like chemotaxis protein